MYATAALMRGPPAVSLSSTPTLGDRTFARVITLWKSATPDSISPYARAVPMSEHATQSSTLCCRATLVIVHASRLRMQMNVSALSVDDGRRGLLQFRSLLMPSADRRLTVRTAILRRPLALSALLRPLGQQGYAALAASPRGSQ